MVDQSEMHQNPEDVSPQPVPPEKQFKLRQHSGNLKNVTEGRFDLDNLSTDVFEPQDGEITPDQNRILYRFHQDFRTVATGIATSRYMLERTTEMTRKKYSNGQEIPVAEMSKVETRLDEVIIRTTELIQTYQEWLRIRTVLDRVTDSIGQEQVGVMKERNRESLAKQLEEEFIKLSGEKAILEQASSEQHKVNPIGHEIFTEEMSLQLELVKNKLGELSVALKYLRPDQLYDADLSQARSEAKPLTTRERLSNAIKEKLQGIDHPSGELIRRLLKVPTLGNIPTPEADRLISTIQIIENEDVPDSMKVLREARADFAKMREDLKGDPRFSTVLETIEESQLISTIDAILESVSVPQTPASAAA